ncbi:MAG: DNA mismatch repair endonuclease MutL [Synergistaceae bacterium]|jgi:DNA mismatch repair protein MutL|nr:DNA mismatch repair endonuclease MutL [Synergistaceae bacterium]
MSIKLLPEGVWARIAAGEVVERPASAVKEMIENSLDAGARRIRVKLWDGGRVRIVVEDDGAGIAFEELPLALMPHATSKIGGIEDLEAIHTLGYRGEALASLAAVAKVEIRSRPSDRSNRSERSERSEKSERDDGRGDEGTGGAIRAYEGRVLEHLRVNCVPGTRVQVDELFVNLPARRKFLKSAAGELRRAATTLREYAICRPEVGFALEHDGRPIFSTDGGGDRRRAIQQLWGAEPEILTVRSKAGHVEVECWWQPRQGRNEITSFVNGRSVTDPLIKGAVNAAARELAGGWALFFSVDPSLIDVNIHPAKAEIRFRHPGEVFDAVKEAAAQLGAPAPVYAQGGRTFSTESRRMGTPQSFAPSPSLTDEGNFQEEDFQVKGLQVKDFQEGSSQGESSRGESWDFKNFDNFENVKVFQTQTSEPPVKKSSPHSAPFNAPRPDRLFGRIEMPEMPEMSEMPEMAKMPDTSDPTEYLGQLSSGYLVFGTPDGLAVVDPHAAHERVAFERIQAAAKEGERSQDLLTPVLLPPTLQLEAEEKQETLESVGFALESVEGGLRLTSVPFLANAAVTPEALLRGSLAALRDGEGAEAAELLWRTWATMACKGAVKVTTKLEPEEALALWEELHRCRQPFFCPHGRPTILSLSNAELAKHFGRT